MIQRFKGISFGVVALASIIGLLLYLDSSTFFFQGTDSDGSNTASPQLTDVDTLMDQMSVREKAAQLMIVWIRGNFQPDDSETLRSLTGLVQNHQIGGFIFASSDVYNQAVLTNRLQSVSKIPLWISQDMETGAAMRINGTTRFTAAMGVAATGNPDYNYQKGRITAIESKAVGVHQIYAPVLDVNNNPGNPVINTRSYSEDPHVVGVFAKAFIAGAQEHGVMATGKHFPGHGDTSVDSHLALPVIPHSYERLDTLELIPFKMTIEAGLQSIMTAHIAFPAVGSDPSLPGTLDPAILNGILRDSLGFDGLIVTDALEMDGVSRHFSAGQAAVLSLLAGADVLLLPNDVHLAIDAVVEAVESGVLPVKVLDNAVRRFLNYKVNYGLFERTKVDIDKLSTQINTQEFRLLADEIARASITLLKNNRNIVPIRAATYPKISIVILSDDRTGSSGNTFAATVRQYHPDVRYHVIDARSGSEEIESAIRSAGQSDLILLGTAVFVRTSNDIELTNRQKRIISRLNNLKKPLVHTTFGNPYTVRDVQNADVHMMAWGASALQQEAAAHALFGASQISGKLPITIPGLYKYGHGINLPHSVLRSDHPAVVSMVADTLYQIDEIMRRAIANRVFPGGVVAVVKDDVIAFNRAYGYHDYENKTRVRSSDVFDLASITKVMATTLGIMKLIDDGKIKLEDKVSAHLNEFDTPEKRDITIYQLLTHTSGLPAFRVYVDQIKNRRDLLKAILTEPLINPPGVEYVYSDLGLITAAVIIERISGMNFPAFMDRNFYTPMGMNMTTFNPKRRGTWYTNRILPTEIDTVYRNKVIRAEVHDERAYYLDGNAGHAGLFSNTADIAKFVALLMNKGTYAGRRYISESVVSDFIRRQAPHNRRGIGFDMKTMDGFSSAGSLSSLSTYGHTGFTGTSFWIDPERNTAIIILTNRTYPYRGSATGIAQVRSNIADVVIRSIN